MKYPVRRSLDFIDSWLKLRLCQVDNPGVALAIHYNDNLVFSKAYGYACLENNVAMTPQHLFRVASLTKLFTAAAILQLYEQKKLLIDEPIVHSLPWLKEHSDTRYRSITIQQVLSHSSGLIRDCYPSDYWHGVSPFPDRYTLQHFVLNTPLCTSTPQTGKYSNLGYALLGEIIERKSNKSYAQYIQEHIIEPLDLTDTYPEVTPSVVQGLAQGYSRAFNRMREPIERKIPTHAFISAGGLCTTASDMCKFLAARQPGDNRLLRDSSKQLLHRSYIATLKNGQASGSFGLGCFINKLGTRTIIRQSGSFPGYHSSAMADIDNRLIATAITNSNDPCDESIVSGIFSIFDFFEKYTPLPTRRWLRKFEGQFFSRRGVDEFIATNDGVVAINPNDWSPFASPEYLAYIDKTTLKIIQARASAYAPEELVRFNFRNPKPTVDYAGTALKAL